MRTITSAGGHEENVTVRRSESADAQRIDGLISASTTALFGRVNVIHLLEKANLAVTLANEQQDILAHAAFFDHPVGDLVDQCHWEAFLQKHFSTEDCTPVNTLFLHLFVAQPDFAAASAKEIMRAVFDAVPELEFICLLTPNTGGSGEEAAPNSRSDTPAGSERSFVAAVCAEAALGGVFEPLRRPNGGGPPCSAFMCHRQRCCPKLLIRPARVEDHDDILRIFEEQKKTLLLSRPYCLTDLIQEDSEHSHTAVLESDGVAVAFIAVTSNVDLKRLHGNFDLSGFNGLYKHTQQSDAAEKEEEEEEEEEEEGEGGGEEEREEGEGEEGGKEEDHNSNSQQQEEAAAEHLAETSNAFCIQLFVIDKHYEMRSAEFIPYMFSLFQDLDFCIITVPTATSDFQLLQSFLRLKPFERSTLPYELYVLHRTRPRKVKVRAAMAADRPAVSDLLRFLHVDHSLLQDLDLYWDTRRDPGGVPLQAFVLQVSGQVVGVLIIRDEQDIEYLRAHYNVENFIYFSHHRYEEHAHIRHFLLHPSFQCLTRHFFKDALRLAHRSCLFHRAYPPHHDQGNSCVHHLDFVFDCSVPVRPRRQIVYPLEELGSNGPSRQLTEEQAPFALSLISRKLTMEPKVTVNARIVVVGASDTGLSFLEVLCVCPHLRFNNLTLISTHGFPSDGGHEDPGFLSTSHAYSSRDFDRLPLRFCVDVVTGKMVAINRKSKYVLVSDGRKVPYDHLILCTGLQYQVPCPSGADLSQTATNSQLQAPPPPRRYTGPVPSNLLTLNDLHDCLAARRWLCANFVELEDNAVVYGDGVDVFTAAEALLGLGVKGSRVHVVLTPPEVSCFSDPAVEKAVAAALQGAGVSVHRGRLLQADGGGKADTLSSAEFRSNGGILHLQCGVFINLSNKGVDFDAFDSINGSFLVFDRRLVINSAYATNDPHVYGAGTLTKFSRGYYADEWSHDRFSSAEVGRGLAAALLPLFDPTMEDSGPAETQRLTPLLKEPKVQGGKLPGGLHYLSISRPCAASEAGPSLLQAESRGLSTGRAEAGSYFSVHLDGSEVVERLTCLSLKPLPLSNYLKLYGKHQQLLGQLCLRYHQGHIHDLHSFFRQKWCFAIYHDRFSDFEQELQQITSTTEGEEELRQQMRSSAAKYLTYNRNLLPMFASPGQL